MHESDSYTLFASWPLVGDQEFATLRGVLPWLIGCWGRMGDLVCCSAAVGHNTPGCGALQSLQAWV